MIITLQRYILLRPAIHNPSYPAELSTKYCRQGTLNGKKGNYVMQTMATTILRWQSRTQYIPDGFPIQLRQCLVSSLSDNSKRRRTGPRYVPTRSTCRTTCVNLDAFFQGEKKRATYTTFSRLRRSHRGSRSSRKGGRNSCVRKTQVNYFYVNLVGKLVRLYLTTVRQ